MRDTHERHTRPNAKRTWLSAHGSRALLVVAVGATWIVCGLALIRIVFVVLRSLALIAR